MNTIIYADVVYFSSRDPIVTTIVIARGRKRGLGNFRNGKD